MNMRDYSTLNIDINSNKGATCSKKRYGSK